MARFDRTHTRFPLLTRLLAVGVLLQVPLLTGCGTIMQGSTQQIGISSVPTSAQVTVNGAQRGTTPLVLDLKRKDTQLITVSLEGYAPYEIPLTRSVSGWVWGNLVFGGLPGLAVDAITGGLYKLTPEQVSAQLQASGVEVAQGGDVVLVTVVLQAEAGWERVGSLERE